ncbi:MAG: hypothetical protein ACK5DE_09840 [Bacteroidota bacterium]|jgi:hypothetical protein
MKKQTVVQQLIEKLIAKSKENDPNNFTIQIYFESNKDLIEQALEMEKQQMLEFWNGGIDCTEERGKSFEQYYKETHEQKEE